MSTPERSASDRLRSLARGIRPERIDTPAGGHDEARCASAPTREAGPVPPAGRCPVHRRAKVVYIDPTGGDTFMGGPVLIATCSKCGRETI